MVNTLNELQQTEQTVKHLLKNKNVRESLKKFDSATAIRYLSELYKGNGWIVSFHAPSGHPSALLLSYPKNPQQTVLIVRIDCSTHELNFDDCRDHLLYFENELSALYSCSQFCLIALNSFEARAEKLESFNLLLQDWSYVEELIENYSADNIREPRIQLFAHNKTAYKKVLRAFTEHKAVAVVQATGTGKSYLIAKVLQDYAGENRLVLAPSHYILDQLKEHIRWEKETILFMTYQRAMNLTENEIKKLGVKFLVLDEFHRCGADEWGYGVQNILDAYPNVRIFGTSATPVRHLDNNRDMAQELFNGTIAENLNLAQAIVRNILPMPKYITALYTLKDEADEMRMRISRSLKSEKDKAQIQTELDTFEIEWQNSYGIPALFKKYIRNGMNKFLVFCKEESHLNEMEALVKGWFHDAFPGKKVKTFRVLSSEKEKLKNFNDFKTIKAEDEIHLLFSINMLNEGLHVNDVNGVILLRPTVSPIIFYQQIGRCLKVGMNKAPVIFDLVNNFNSIHCNDFLYDLESSRISYLKDRNELSLEDRCPLFTIHDEVRQITEVFGEIRFKLDNWNDMFKSLENYYNTYGNTRVSKSFDKRLSGWTIDQRKRYRQGFLSSERIDCLNRLQFEWSVLESEWENSYNDLIEFKNEFGHLKVPANGKFSKLFTWTSMQRNAYRKGCLPAERLRRLQQAGFSFNPSDDQFDEMFEKLKQYYLKNGDCKVSSRKYSKLYSWVASKRTSFRNGILNKKYIERLNALDPKWNIDYDQERWNNFIAQLILFKEKYCHCNVSHADKEHTALGYMVRDARSKYKQGLLNREQINQLESLGISWNRFADTWNEQYEKLKIFYLEHGHSNIRQGGNDEKLASFVSINRKSFKDGKLSAEKTALLNDLKIKWDVLSENWQQKFESLKQYKDKNGHCRVTKKANYFLDDWCSKQRKRFKNGFMNEREKELLASIGFEFIIENPLGVFRDKKGNKFLAPRIKSETRIKELQKFKAKHGHLMLAKFKEYDSLYKWLGQQKVKHNCGGLEPHIQKALDDLGVVWKTNEAAWMKKYSFLKNFFDQNGHSMFGDHNRKLKYIVDWMKELRIARRAGKLDDHKIALLDKIDFDWTGDRKKIIQWNIELQKLKTYEEKYGDLMLRKYCSKEDKEANAIIENVRKSWRNKTLPEFKHQSLIELDFVFDLDQYYNQQWNQRLKELKEFKHQYDHCRVPAKWNKNLLLANFVIAQRQAYKKNKISPDKLKLLEETGFEWKVK